jgi:hypothetical protein
MNLNEPPSIPILYEDQDLVVLNKPPGVVVNQAETHSAPTLQAWMQAHLSAHSPVAAADWQSLVPIDFSDEFGTPEEIFAERQGIVHRLDKDTSGVIVLAKNPGSLVSLLRQFKLRQTEKQYLALVHGKMQAPQATLSFPIGRASQDRKMFAVRPDGRTAETLYKVQAMFKSIDLMQAGAAMLQRWQEEHPDEKPLTLFQLQKRISIYQGFSLVTCWPKAKKLRSSLVSTAFFACSAAYTHTPTFQRTDDVYRTPVA